MGKGEWVAAEDAGFEDGIFAVLCKVKCQQCTEVHVFRRVRLMNPIWLEIDVGLSLLGRPDASHLPGRLVAGVESEFHVFPVPAYRYA